MVLLWRNDIPRFSGIQAYHLAFDVQSVGFSLFPNEIHPNSCLLRKYLSDLPTVFLRSKKLIRRESQQKHCYA